MHWDSHPEWKCVFVIAVCRGLIKNGERQDEESVGGRRRTEALRQLCQMNPSQALNIRAMVVSGKTFELNTIFQYLQKRLDSNKLFFGEKNDTFYEKYGEQ